MPPYVTRFAPSPTGYLHVGHAFSALISFNSAEQAGGVWLLRLEDIDAGRCRPEYEAAILEDLAWLGLRWPDPVRRQSEHMPRYQQALGRLQSAGLLYRCFKTRKEIAAAIASAPHDLEGATAPPTYVGAPLPPAEEQAQLDVEAPFAWRLSMAKARDYLGDAWAGLAFQEHGAGPDGETGVIQAAPAQFGDVVLARKDFPTSYHLASVMHDADQGVSEIVLGADLFAATHIHRLLQALLDLPTPTYRHHKLITDADGKRLAKRDKSATLRALRAAGATPQTIRARLGLD